MADSKATKEYAEVPQSEEQAAQSKMENAVEGEEGGAIRLQAKMSLMNGITVIVGSIIGSGIFISPTGVLVQTGSVNLALIVWVVSGISPAPILSQSLALFPLKLSAFIYPTNNNNVISYFPI